MDNKNTALVWAVFYGGLMAMAMHPSGRKGCPPFQVSEFCFDENAKIADEMMDRYFDRVHSGVLQEG